MNLCFTNLLQTIIIPVLPVIVNSFNFAFYMLFIMYSTHTGKTFNVHIMRIKYKCKMCPFPLLFHYSGGLTNRLAYLTMNSQKQQVCDAVSIGVLL